MIDAPSGGAPEQAPRWDLVDTESYGGGIRVLAPYLIVWGTWVYIGGRSTSMEQQGAHEGGGRAPLPRGLLKLSLRALQVFRTSFLPKMSSMKFQVNWTPFDFPFLRNPKTR